MEVVNLHLPLDLGDIVKQYCSKYDRCYWKNKITHPFTPTREQLASLVSRRVADSSCVERAASLGCLDLLQELLPNGPQGLHWFPYIEDVKIWQWIYEWCMKDPQLTARMKDIFHPNYIANVEIYHWFQEKGLIRKPVNVLRAAVQYGRMDLVNMLIDLQCVPTAPWVYDAALKGHINIIDWAYHTGLILNWSHLLSSVVREFPAYDKFYDLVCKTNTTAVDPRYYNWNATSDVENKQKILNLMIEKFNYKVTKRDVSSITHSKQVVHIHLPDDTFQESLSLKQLKWLDKIIDKDELRGVVKRTNQFPIRSEECVAWFISHGLELTLYNRLSILRVCEEKLFAHYVNDEVALKTQWHKYLYDPQLLYMARYMLKNNLKYEMEHINHWRFSIKNVEIATFIVTNYHKKITMRDLEYVSLQKSLDALVILRPILPLEELMCEFVKNVKTMNQYLQLFPETDLTHPSIVEKAHEDYYEFLLFYLMSVHPELCRDSAIVKRAKWGFELKRKRV